ncbi:MAG: UDP-N-acetylmuramoyl-tripeptide--D-alanyl-D-alanine ligase [Dysgonamonadaceae bacterium]|jgi:UDP-N-acetylmuramoyl-tripeptide--D-alanyl-D-alanine ligase|nr:UDP-N-acetylmuramoyl-tripeptide--D-alanyl-D-alanine ligase [Dysgonamonadaceae bacterium]
MKITELYKIYKQNPVITTDTRKCVPYSMFFALKGENFDGNDYIEQALEQGCAYVVGDNPELPKNNHHIIPVKNVLHTLQELARFHRRTLQIPVIGITGTNGKTTTKELIAAVLSSKYNVLYTQGNLNNHIGVPLTLLSMTEKHDIAVIEMGANHLGEIAELAAIAEPNYGLITNVGKAHLEGFGSFENVIKTKSELYHFLGKTGGKIFINQDNPYLNAVPVDAEKTYYGTQPGIFIRGEIVESDSPFLTLKWFIDQQGYEVKTQLIGNYNFENVLAAAAIGTYFKVEPDKICEALTNYSPQNNRSQLLETSKNHLIVDAYNANPTSMLASLENFSKMRFSHKAVILGDMKELGKDSVSEHQKILDFIDKAQFEKVFLCGEIFSDLSKNKYPSFPHVEQLVEDLKNENLKEYYILIKGSRGIKLEKVIDYL